MSKKHGAQGYRKRCTSRISSAHFLPEHESLNEDAQGIEHPVCSIPFHLHCMILSSLNHQRIHSPQDHISINEFLNRIVMNTPSLPHPAWPFIRHRDPLLNRIAKRNVPHRQCPRSHASATSARTPDIQLPSIQISSSTYDSRSLIATQSSCPPMP